MSTLSILLIIVALVVVQVIGLVIVFGWLKRRMPEEGAAEAGQGEGAMLLLQQQVQDLAKTLDARVAQSSQQMHETMRAQLGESNRLIKEITTEITSVKEIGRQTQGFAEQLQNLQDILKNPKQRGILGEYYLETVLKNVLPPGMYQMQYPFKNGEIVDAAVFVNEKVVPIDSKFSLDNYNRFIAAKPEERAAFEKTFVNDLKLRIQETAKYIRPEENTMDFAFMFIPSEGIYYDLLTNQVGAGDEENLIQRAASKYKVIIVSPTSFLAYLQTVLQGLKALQIEKQAEEIQKRVGELGKHLGSYEEFYRKLGVALGTAVSHYNSGYKELGKVDKDVYRITDAKIGIDPLALEKPSAEVE
jgi:DNA recombination protein RmuC